MSIFSSRKGRLILISSLLIIMVCLAGWYLLANHSTTTPKSAANLTVKSAPSTQLYTTGGVLVPKELQAKARSLGYYCPSWDASSGQSSPDICVPLKN